MANLCHPLEFELELREHKWLPADLLPTDFPTLFFEVDLLRIFCSAVHLPAHGSALPQLDWPTHPVECWCLFSQSVNQCFW